MNLNKHDKNWFLNFVSDYFYSFVCIFKEFLVLARDYFRAFIDHFFCYWYTNSSL